MTAPIRERGILFSGPMVRAILDGRKTVTRRVVREARWFDANEGDDPSACGYADENGDWHSLDSLPCPYAVGMHLWVRETWRKIHEDGGPVLVEYRADGRRVVPVTATGASVAGNGDDTGERWRPSIFMPRWASRITLEVTGVRVERLHAITEEDARAEGMPCSGSYRAGFADGWDTSNGCRLGAAWKDNPWVFVIAFR